MWRALLFQSHNQKQSCRDQIETSRSDRIRLRRRPLGVSLGCAGVTSVSQIRGFEESVSWAAGLIAHTWSRSGRQPCEAFNPRRWCAGFPI